MLTAAQARKISKSVTEDTSKMVKHCVKDILIDIKKRAERGYCQYILDITNYPRDMRMPIVHMLENLGYKTRPHTWSGDIYIISW